MFKSVQTKIIFMLVIFIFAVMAVVGTVLINGVASYGRGSFVSEIEKALTDDFMENLAEVAAEGKGEEIKSFISAYYGSLGISLERNFYILKIDGSYVTGSNEELGRALDITPNIVEAMAGSIGNEVSVYADFADYARAFQAGENEYIIYFKDTLEEMREMTWMMFFIILQSILFGFILALLLSYLLSRAITEPIKNLTSGAKRIASGDFSYKITQSSSHDEIGTLTKTFGYMANVLDNTLHEISEERSRLETIFLYMTDGVIAFDDEGKLTHMNKVAAELFGDMWQVGFSTFEDVFTNRGILQQEDIKTGTSQSQKATVNGREIELYFATLAKTEENNDGGIIIVAHDITEQQRLEAARREFVANVSHEMRTPLTSIKGAAETVYENPDMPPHLRDKFLKMTMNEADRMTRIVKDLLVLSRLDNNRMQWQKTDFSIPELLSRVYSAQQMTAEKTGHTLTMKVADGVDTIYGDKERVEQVIVNLLSNAIKYSPDGGDIEIVAVKVDETVQISVTDHGIGIPKEDLPRLFERFYRVDKARSREMGGTGLGLSIAREIAVAHGGDIYAESELGKGTKMTAVFPVNYREEVIQ
ncbi:MAG: cell wall metabolism sensor histidine kinase WalK [Ruminococcaceae bacterium]|nr:cell wall metabolism sensor histidine kinase WalK [Oscillospiraceae bacterium]